MHEDDVARLSGQFDDPDGDAGNSGALLHQPYDAVAGGTGRVGLQCRHDRETMIGEFGEVLDMHRTHSRPGPPLIYAAGRRGAHRRHRPPPRSPCAARTRVDLGLVYWLGQWEPGHDPASPISSAAGRLADVSGINRLGPWSGAALERPEHAPVTNPAPTHFGVRYRRAGGDEHGRKGYRPHEQSHELGTPHD
jgi:hypothetical protein